MSFLKNGIYMDYSLVRKLFRWKKEDFLQSLMSDYRERGYAVVNYLYFASAMKYRLFEYQENITHIQYKNALTESTFFLADGIALQIFVFVVNMLRFSPDHWMVHNLNGTDLTPYLLRDLPEYGTVSVYLYNLYDPRIGKTEDWNEKAIESFKFQFPEVSLIWTYTELYAQRGQNISAEELEQVCKTDKNQYKLFLNCTGSPFQEIWAYENIDFFKRNNFIVLNSGGVIDFISGFEKRAPGLLVRLRVFETFWRILINPKKNLPKFLSMFWVFRIIGKTFSGSLVKVFIKR